MLRRIFLFGFFSFTFASGAGLAMWNSEDEGDPIEEKPVKTVADYLTEREALKHTDP